MAIPAPSSGAGPRSVAPAKNSTVPVGVAPEPVTAAVSVTGSPNLVESGEAATAVVAARRTRTATAGEVLAANPASPR